MYYVLRMFIVQATDSFKGFSRSQLALLKISAFLNIKSTLVDTNVENLV
jgi:hypothetical protein